MAVDTTLVRQQAQNLANSVGKAGRHALYPRDFEYYAISLELTDSNDNTIDYFLFPVMPKSIVKTESSRVNIKKSLTSINVINSKSFQPQDISIKGNFGRSFSMLIDPTFPITFKALSYSLRFGIYSALDTGNEFSVKNLVGVFNPAIKTGYGCQKILQSIIDKARGTDKSGKPFKLYLYNPALGENYLVVPGNTPLTFSQNENESNMIWEYSLNLIAISPLDRSKNKIVSGSTVQLLAADNIQKGVNSVASTLRRAL
jgi:hypothetical protein